MFNLLAHEGEDHEQSVEAAQHLFEVSPWVATPLALLVFSSLIFAVHKIFKKPNLTYAVLIFGLLAIGLLTYSALPVLSVIAIIAGFFISLATVLLGAGGKK